MLLLIARLGLRAPEVAAIRLEDINWRAGEILIRGKGQLHDRMPLPAEVGAAIVDYIQNERRGEDRTLFVSARPPFRRFKDAQILNWILRKAYDATGINPLNPILARIFFGTVLQRTCCAKAHPLTKLAMYCGTAPPWPQQSTLSTMLMHCAVFPALGQCREKPNEVPFSKTR